MTKGAALQQFFGRFMTAYPSNAVPDDAVLPYLTYDAVFDAWGGGAVAVTGVTDRPARYIDIIHPPKVDTRTPEQVQADFKGFAARHGLKTKERQEVSE